MRIIILVAFTISSLFAGAQKFYLFIGTFSGTGSKGIYVYTFDASTGAAKWVSNTDTVANPGYLANSSDGKYLYAVNEVKGAGVGSVSAYYFNRGTGKLQFINTQKTGGENPCYVSITNNNKWIAVANYGGGNISVFQTGKNGSLQPYAQMVQHTGNSVNTERQEKAHLHSAVFSPDQQYIFTPDLGIDKVMIYRFKSSSKTPLIPAEPAFALTDPGSGPRHFTFSPNNRFAYLIEELSGTVEAYKYHDGKLQFIQKIATHPDDYKGVIGSADIHLSPDGKFLYASNRGDQNNIAIFSVDKTTGMLALLGYQSTSGSTPRNFIIDPTGNYLLAANQNTDNIVIFKRDKQTGMLSPTGTQIKIPRPVCLKIIK